MMSEDSRVTPRRGPPTAALRAALCLTMLASACVPASEEGSSGSGGAAAGGTGGRTNPGSGGSGSGGSAPAGSGGSVGSGGSGSGGAVVTGSGGRSNAGSGGASGAGGSAGRAGSGGRGGSVTGSGGSGSGAPDGGVTDGGATGGSTGAGGSPAAGRSAGCGKTSTMTFGSVPGEPPNGFGMGGYVTIQSGGGSRGFALRLPDNYDRNKPYWLIFGFHWRGGTAANVDNGGSNGYIMAHYGLQALSKNGAIFVAPQGLNGGWGNSGGQDMRFVDDMLKLISDNYCVDTTHIFANGFSWGGGMSYSIACSRAKVFRGIAIYNGGVLSGCEGGTEPIAYWQMAGLEDTTLNVDQGVSMRDRFVKNNGCTAGQEPPRPPRGPPYLANGGHVCTNYTGCSAGHPVRWCVHQSGHGNAVVDGTGDLYNRCATPPMMCSDSCRCTWVPQDVWTWMNSL